MRGKSDAEGRTLPFPMERLVCPGSARVSSPKRRWYVPPNKTSQECTYCEVCFDTHIRGTPSEDGFSVRVGLENCCCDYKLIKQDKIGVVLAPAGGFTWSDTFPFRVVEGQGIDGVVYYDVPTCSPYVINVYSFYGDYFTLVKGSVGGRPIVINDGWKMYYKNNIRITGYTKDADDSFVFVSSPSESSENIIRLTVQRWKKISNRYHTAADTFDPIGEPIQFTIQLVCSQTNEEKQDINKAYFAAKRQEEKRKLIIEHSTLQQRIQEGRTLLLELETQLSAVSEKLLAIISLDKGSPF
jgi:hypothetical protein